MYSVARDFWNQIFETLKLNVENGLFEKNLNTKTKPWVELFWQVSLE